MRPSLRTALDNELAELDRAHRLRSCPPLHGGSRIHPVLCGTRLVSFCSNDYLGLATHPDVLAAARGALDRVGLGAGASRLVAGDLEQHRSLEAQLADWLDTEAALLFPSGYQANLGVFSALADHRDLIVSDALNHASLIDGCRLSRATVRVFPHGDVARAAACLAEPGAPFRRRFVVTESVFSMEGDAAPLLDLAGVAAHHDAILIVDEAHALGVLGPRGTGLAGTLGLKPDVLIGTLGKALGAAGGFVAGAKPLRDILINRARTFIYTTAAPPVVLAGAEAALALCARDEGDRRRERLLRHANDLRGTLGYPTAAAAAIIPVLAGVDERAVAAAAELRAEGLFVQPIRPPTVPAGTARLRITLSAAHTDADVRRLGDALVRLGFGP